VKLMDSCRRAAELITQARDEPLGLFDRWKLNLHLAMCKNCRNVDDQIAHLGDLVRDLLDDDGSVRAPPGNAGRSREADGGARRIP
jgi:predicted anti-sigma-YlaC factor YlaD